MMHGERSRRLRAISRDNNHNIYHNKRYITSMLKKRSRLSFCKASRQVILLYTRACAIAHISLTYMYITSCAFVQLCNCAQEGLECWSLQAQLENKRDIKVRKSEVKREMLTIYSCFRHAHETYKRQPMYYKLFMSCIIYFHVFTCYCSFFFFYKWMCIHLLGTKLFYDIV